MAAINLIAVASSACIALGMLWVFVAMKMMGNAEAGAAASVASIPGLFGICIGVVLALLNGLLVVLS